MDTGSLEGLLESTDDPVEMFRNNDVGWQPYVFPDEYTNWIEEQRAIRDAVGIVDQSYHMEVLRIAGPDALEFLAGLGANSFEKLRAGDPPAAINLLLCNPDGYKIGDVILFHLEDGEFTSVGAEFSHNWLRYNAGVTDLDVETDLAYTPFDEQSPPEFRFQVQGPDALDVLAEVVDGDLPDIPFFGMDTVEIDGVETYALAHGMAATPGLEIFGPYEGHDRVRDAILAAGRQYGIRRIGSKAYKTGKIGSGWIPVPLPAIYVNDELREYREWLSAESGEAQLSIGGSYVPDDLAGFYMTPMELGQGQFLDFDDDFVGREALEGTVEDRNRERVTFVWDEGDVADLYASLFREGPTGKFLDLPDTANLWSVTHYDEVLKDGATVGLSKYPGYLYYEREMLSLGTIDPAYSDPGTEVRFVWGEDTEKRRVERHERRTIGATVAPSPYVRGGRRP